MASESQGPGESASDNLSISELIKKVAARNARASLDDEEQLTLFLRSWWSKTYNRPLLDPLLQSYTLEQLLYEFYDRIERAAAENERMNKTVEVQEDKKMEENLDWAEKMEREELAQAAKPEVKEVQDPAKDPANIKWMEEQMKIHKGEFGETFGEDIEEGFE